jgi:DNA-binding LacI/PurR family transcriptional regulator
MTKPETDHPHIVALAERLVADIRRRGLAIGDRYMTVEAVSLMLGVRRAVAGKAIRQLAEQEILIPKQRTGTFVGPGLKRQNRSKVRTVFVLLPAGDPSASHWSYKPFVTGIRGEISEANVQFTFVPETDPVEYVRELIDGARTLGQFVGVIAVSCPGEVYSFLADQRVPAVAFGSLCSPDMPLTSVDADNALCGRLLIEYLVGAGHRRMALMMSSAGRPGDNDFLDGICDALAVAGLPANALIHRLSRSHLDGVRAMSKEMLERPDRPTAIITRGVYPAEAVASTARGLGLRVPEDLEIVFTHADETAPRLNAESYPRVEPTMSFTEIARMIGKILRDMTDGASPQPQRVLIPVELHVPERDTNV